MLAASMPGSTSRFASPASVERGMIRRRSSLSRAASPCISPSTSSSGACSRSSARASRIFSALGWLEVPKLECDNKATLGRMPKRSSSSAAIRVISASCAAVGSTFTWVSTSVTCRLGSISVFMAA